MVTPSWGASDKPALLGVRGEAVSDGRALRRITACFNKNLSTSCAALLHLFHHDYDVQQIMTFQIVPLRFTKW